MLDDWSPQILGDDLNGSTPALRPVVILVNYSRLQFLRPTDQMIHKVRRGLLFMLRRAVNRWICEYQVNQNTYKDPLEKILWN